MSLSTAGHWGWWWGIRTDDCKLVVDGVQGRSHSHLNHNVPYDDSSAMKHTKRRDWQRHTICVAVLGRHGHVCTEKNRQRLAVIVWNDDLQAPRTLGTCQTTRSELSDGTVHVGTGDQICQVQPVDGYTRTDAQSRVVTVCSVEEVGRIVGIVCDWRFISFQYDRVGARLNLLLSRRLSEDWLQDGRYQRHGQKEASRAEHHRGRRGSRCSRERWYKEGDGNPVAVKECGQGRLKKDMRMMWKRSSRGGFLHTSLS